MAIASTQSEEKHNGTVVIPTHPGAHFMTAVFKQGRGHAAGCLVAATRSLRAVSAKSASTRARKVQRPRRGQYLHKPRPTIFVFVALERPACTMEKRKKLRQSLQRTTWRPKARTNPKRNPKCAPREPNGTQKVPRGRQKEPGEPQGAQKGPQNEPKMRQSGPQMVAKM